MLMTKTSLWLLLLVLGDSKLPLELWQVIFLPVGDGASPWELALDVIISNLEITHPTWFKIGKQHSTKALRIPNGVLKK